MRLATGAPGNRFLVLGNKSSDWGYRVTRHAEDGTLEAQWPVARPTIHCDSCSSFLFGMARQVDGKVVLAGTTSGPFSAGPWVQKVFVTRYTLGGTPDVTFAGGAGIAVIQPEVYTQGFSLHLRADGRIVVSGQAGSGERTPDPSSAFGASRIEAGQWMLAGLTSEGLPDALFGTSGVVRPAVVHGSRAPRATLQSDGRIVAAGESPTGFLFARLSPSGVLERHRALLIPATDGIAVSQITVAADDRVWISTGLANGSQAQGTLSRLLSNGDDDPTLAGSPGFLRDINLYAILPLPDGGALVEARGMPLGSPPSLELLRFAPDGSISRGFADQGFLRIHRLTMGAAAVMPDGKVLGTGGAFGPLVNEHKTAVFRLDLAAHAFTTSDWLDFGVQSWGTASPPVMLTVRNVASADRAISVASSTGYPAATDCTTLAAGASCTVQVQHQPVVPGGSFGDLRLTSGTLTITGGGDLSASVALYGAVSHALVDHYYRSSFGRAPDAGGRHYWINQAIRIRTAIQGLSSGNPANVSEAWYALAMTFFGSAEYAAYGRGDGAFVTDLYRTFFDREPDAAGLAYWTGLVVEGLPRDAALASFMFSPEFVQFNATFYGGAANRPEIDTVLDLYRGFLARLPDDAGLAYWVGRMQQAQCEGAQLVAEEVATLSRLFSQSDEYLARGRATSSYVADLYNAFLRRGADLDGLRYWVRQIDSGALSRGDARRAFIASPEFNARVQAIVATGCKG